MHDRAIKYMYFVSEFKAGCSLYIAIPCYRCESLSVTFWSRPQASCKKWVWRKRYWSSFKFWYPNKVVILLSLLYSQVLACATRRQLSNLDIAETLLQAWVRVSTGVAEVVEIVWLQFTQVWVAVIQPRTFSGSVHFQLSRVGSSSVHSWFQNEYHSNGPIHSKLTLRVAFS